MTNTAYIFKYVNTAKPSREVFFKALGTKECKGLSSFISKELAVLLSHPKTDIRERATEVFGYLAVRQGHDTFPAAEMYGVQCLTILCDYILNGNKAASYALRTAPIGVLMANYGRDRVSELVLQAVKEAKDKGAMAKRIGAWSELLEIRVSVGPDKILLTEYIKLTYKKDPAIYGKDIFDTIRLELEQWRPVSVAKLITTILPKATSVQKQKLYMELIRQRDIRFDGNAKPVSTNMAYAIFSASGDWKDNFIKALPKEWLTLEFITKSNNSLKLQALRPEIEGKNLPATAANAEKHGFSFTPKNVTPSGPIKIQGKLDLETFVFTFGNVTYRLIAEKSEYSALRALYGKEATVELVSGEYKYPICGRDIFMSKSYIGPEMDRLREFYLSEVAYINGTKIDMVNKAILGIYREFLDSMPKK